MTARPEEDPDLELLGRIGSGDAAAVRTMVERKLRRLLALATRMLGDPIEAEDIAQECFVRLWRQAPQWRPGGARVDTWLHRVALNLCYDRLRKRREIMVELLPDGPDPGQAPNSALDDADRVGEVAAVLQALPERQREAIVLQYYQELSNIEAAAAMEISVEALESLLARARRRLRMLLGD